MSEKKGKNHDESSENGLSVGEREEENRAPRENDKTIIQMLEEEMNESKPSTRRRRTKKRRETVDGGRKEDLD